MEEASSNNSTDGNQNIAKRTRSHVRMDDFETDDNLNFPDVDPNLYSNPDSDGEPETKDYKKFLYDTFSYKDDPGTAIDEEDDPDFKYNDHIFSPDFNWDMYIYEQLAEQDRLRAINVIANSNEPQASSSSGSLKAIAVGHTVSRKIDIFADQEFARILNQQLRQHIQLLTQTFLLTNTTTNMEEHAAKAKHLLEAYVKVFGDRNKPSNLNMAIDLVRNTGRPNNLQSSIRLSWRPLPIPESVKTIIRANPNLFMYSKLLPQVGFSRLPDKLAPKKPKVTFTENEDRLLAYALKEFKDEPTPYAFIASLLMTAKTKTQISDHIKNIKRSSGSETNPIKLYYTQGLVPKIDPDELAEISPPFYHGFDDLMAASTTIVKAVANPKCVVPLSQTSATNKCLKLKNSLLKYLSNDFSFSQEASNWLVNDFLSDAEKTLGSTTYLRLLEKLSKLVPSDKIEAIYNDLTGYLKEVKAPREMQEKLVLFLNLDQANQCECSDKYLHWIKFFKFMHHVELNHEEGSLEKKLARLIDACKKEDTHKVRLAVANLIGKNSFLKREFDSLDLSSKPHPSLFCCEEDFDDITDPIATFDGDHLCDSYEHFRLNISEEELRYASQSCPCNCHQGQAHDGQHCSGCNLKFMRGRMYLVSRIKPILAEWSYVNHVPELMPPVTNAPVASIPAITTNTSTMTSVMATTTSSSSVDEILSANNNNNNNINPIRGKIEWTLEEDRELLEFCQAKVDQEDETFSFDSSTFEELVKSGRFKKTTSEIAERFNQLMDLYKERGQAA